MKSLISNIPIIEPLLEASEPKWVNPVLDIIGVNSLGARRPPIEIYYFYSYWLSKKSSVLASRIVKNASDYLRTFIDTVYFGKNANLPVIHLPKLFLFCQFKTKTFSQIKIGVVLEENKWKFTAILYRISIVFCKCR